MKNLNAIPKSGVAATAIAAIMALTATAANAATATDTFQVLVEIQKTCSVTAGAGSNIDVGTIASTATNSTGSNDISVTCTTGTPYYIGLAPSAANGGDTAGSGAMASTGGVGGNTDLVPYQLQQAAGAGGTIWGNTATTTTAGNGVAGTGTGAAQSHTVHALVPSANYTADAYADTVTVHVNY